MKIMNIALIIAVFGAAITFHTDSFAKPTNKAAAKQLKSSEIVAESAKSAEATVTIEREKVEEAMVDTEAIKTAATLAINKAREQLAKGEISRVDAAKIIGEQDYRIEQANKLLAMATRRAVDTVEQAEVEEGYTSQLISGARSIGERALAPFKSGYGYSEEEKAIARSIIAQLEKQLEEIIKSYEFKVTATDLKVLNRSVQELDTIKQEFAQAIYEQQLITGDVMSTNRKLFWGAVGLAGAVIGTALARQYLNVEVPTGEILQKETSQEKSLIEQGLEKLNRTEQFRVAEEQPFGGSLVIESALQPGEQSLGGQALERLGGTEQRLAPEEGPFGGSLVIESALQPGEQSLGGQALEKLGGTDQRLAPEEGPFGGSLVIESALQPGEQSLGGQAFEKLGGTEQRLAPEEGPFGGVSFYEGQEVGEKSLSEQGLERLSRTEQRFAPEEQPLGGVSLYEGPEVGEQSLSEQALKRLGRTGQLRATEEQLGENIIVGEQEISSLREKLENLPTETQEEYRARIQKAQESFGRPAAAQAELRQQPRARRSVKEQEELLSEVGQQLSEQRQSAIEAGKTAGTAALSAQQYRTDAEDTGGAVIPSETMEEAVQFGEKVKKAFRAGATAPIDPESGI